jgi:hypothetical protein
MCTKEMEDQRECGAVEHVYPIYEPLRCDCNHMSLQTPER